MCLYGPSDSSKSFYGDSWSDDPSFGQRPIVLDRNVEHHLGLSLAGSFLRLRWNVHRGLPDPLYHFAAPEHTILSS